ncbi:hypothetical protein CK485_23625 [Streptomyces sp. ICBB 8177]|nr:hypothetical protein CK485_23625 [Streptomyces sp. ICBB 8177]
MRGLLAEWGGWLAVVAGAVLCVLGWYGVSGQSLTQRQLPYLASATVPGAALIVAGAVLLAKEGSAEASARVEELYRLLTEDDREGPPGAPDAPSSSRLLAVPGGTMRHRADCPLVAHRRDATELPPGEGRLDPCPVCEPDR